MSPAEVGSNTELAPLRKGPTGATIAKLSHTKRERHLESVQTSFPKSRSRCELDRLFCFWLSIISSMQAQKPRNGASDEYVSQPFAKPIIIILMTSTTHVLC